MDLLKKIILFAVLSISLVNCNTNSTEFEDSAPLMKHEITDSTSLEKDIKQKETEEIINSDTVANVVDITTIIKKAMNSSVKIECSYALNSDNIYSILSSGSIKKSGSGVIVTSNGYIVTNYHVIDGINEKQITVVLPDGKRYDAKIQGVAPEFDLAVLKIKGEDFPYLTFGSSTNLKVGESVFAIGYPMGIGITVTSGIVSAKSRTLGPSSTSIKEIFIQVDAAVNGGNSGGALINKHGNLVGINSAIYTRNGAFIGYSFAIPSDIVFKVVSDLIKHKKIKVATLGAKITSLDPNFAKITKLKIYKGVYVISVPGNKTISSILKEGDIITGIDKIIIGNLTEFLEQIYAKNPGDIVELTIFRDGETFNISTALTAVKKVK